VVNAQRAMPNLYRTLHSPQTAPAIRTRNATCRVVQKLRDELIGRVSDRLQIRSTLLKIHKTFARIVETGTGIEAQVQTIAAPVRQPCAVREHHPAGNTSMTVIMGDPGIFEQLAQRPVEVEFTAGGKPHHYVREDRFAERCRGENSLLIDQEFACCRSVCREKNSRRHGH
jgi:hypothetical protein